MITDITIRVAFLIFITGLGWCAGTLIKTNSKDISSLLVFIISPFVIFISILESPADWKYFMFSAAAFLTASIAAAITYFIGSLLWKDSRKNLFSFAGGTGNTGYFALPIIFSLFSENQIAIAIFIIIGVNIYEFTIGFFITAKGAMNTIDCFKRITKLPIIYVALFSIAIKSFNIDLNNTVLDSLSVFKGAYSLLGMMVIGITLSAYKKIKIDWTFLFAALGWKHILYPFIGILFFSYALKLPLDILAIVALMLSTPMAGNTVVIANSLGVHPEKAALSVMMSTLLAIITVPLVVLWVSNLSL